MDALALGRAPLTLDDVVAVAHRRRAVTIDPAARARIASIRARVEALLTDDAPNTYGVNTGFGALAEVRIARSDLERLQANLVRSHAAGVGAPYDVPTTRAMMLLRANVLLRGTSGTRPAIAELLVAMLEAGVHPIVPEKGSVGASGDLAPLAHLALVLIGEGEALFGDARLPGGEALARAGLAPVTLAPKEGLALINGTQAMTADAALVLDRARRIAKVADIAGACSLEALLGSQRPFDARIHAMRGQPGQATTAANLRALLAGSALMASHHDCGKVQDPYTLRCMPQVHGTSRDALAYALAVVDRECDAATDNPLVFEGEDGTLDILSGGNFHGQPVAFAADFLAIALSEWANISERRVEQLVNPHLSSGLPAFLAPDSGLHSGFMIAQVTAAALVSENKTLAHPASVDSIPSSANREDHVSMGTWAARKARQVCGNVETVLAIELLCAIQGLDYRRPLASSPAVEAAYACVRRAVPALDADRALHGDIRRVTELVRSGALIEAVEAAVGPLA
ncbi:MAG: histidine ammonia-lyase [Myxococcales bacterium]|nr:histidine ammonia-lyase [Myxococcales bacterium]